MTVAIGILQSLQIGAGNLTSTQRTDLSDMLGARCSQEDNAGQAMPVPPQLSSLGLQGPERWGALGFESATGPRLSALYACGGRGEPRPIRRGFGLVRIPNERAVCSVLRSEPGY